jgi:hypothetical protein
MNDMQPSDFRPDPELAAALRAALELKDGSDHAAFVARVMAQYDRALERATVPTFDVLASWFRPGIWAALASAALLAGFLVGRTILNAGGGTPTSIETALAPAEGSGLADLVTSPNPPDASVAYASLVNQR